MRDAHLISMQSDGYQVDFCLSHKMETIHPLVLDHHSPVKMDGDLWHRKDQRVYMILVE